MHTEFQIEKTLHFSSEIYINENHSKNAVGDLRQWKPHPTLLPTSNQMSITPPPSSPTAPPSTPPTPSSSAMSYNLPVYQQHHKLRYTETSPGTYGFQQSTQTASAKQRPAATKMTVRQTERQSRPPTDWKASVAPKPKQPESALSSPNRFALLQQMSDLMNKTVTMMVQWNLSNSRNRNNIHLLLHHL